ncbi:MAG: hypothetical protein DI544_04145 [Sphingomonas taxi]|uniref:BLUF domain-containing protein n=1 Tax=Sphingomonas taxi TaxID=1549858 RepID=A0A2W5PCI6_9SPHN|nr:MAG: hypothetical protein DI544_04145 [Sphingomonas taxi]
MHRFVFSSRAAQPYGRMEIKALCEQSALRNAAGGITGLFLYDGARFLQALEGPDIPLFATIDRISRDPRHYDMTTIQSKTIGEREFHNWSMSQPLFGIGDDPGAYVARIVHDVRHVADAYIRAQFIGFASLARNARYRYE